MAKHARTQWILVDHACRICLGRLLVRTGDNGEKYVKCAECETEVRGSHSALCCCGAKAHDKVPVGLRCQRNDTPTPESPSRVMVKYVGNEQPKHARESVPRRRPKDGGGELFTVIEDADYGE